jgi:hypothetical protein
MRGWVATIAQIAFYVVVGTVAVLTYRKAKDTLLQPIRTEVFKEQLRELSEVLGLFVGKSELDLRAPVGFDRLFYGNATALLDSYAQSTLGVEFESENRPYYGPEYPVTRISKHLVEVADDYLSPEQEPQPTAPRPWSEYRHEIVHVPAEYVAWEESLARLMESPVLPTRCIELLQEYEMRVNENIDLLAETLSTASQELPARYPTLDLMKRARLDWLHNRYNSSFKPLKPAADKVVAFVRGYVGADGLLSP